MKELLEHLRAEHARSQEAIEKARKRIEDLEVACAALPPDVEVEVLRLNRENRRALLRLVAADVEMRLTMSSIERRLAAMEAS